MKIGKAFGTNERLEQDGVWVDLGDGGSVKVARAGNKANRKLLKRLVGPHKAALRSDRLPDDVLEKLTIECMARTILLDWRGIEEDDGKNVEYSVENAIRLLTAYKDFRDQIAASSADLALYQDAAEEAAAKN